MVNKKLFTCVSRPTNTTLCFGFYRQMKATDKILDQLKAGIESVFEKINCDRSAIAEMLGDNDSVNENNMMQYLGIIEQKTNELLQIHTFLQIKELENKPEGAPPGPGTPPVTAIALLGGPAMPATTTQITIVPPSTEDDREEEDDESLDLGRPLTTNELKARVMRNVQKKELLAQTAAAAGGVGQAGKQQTTVEKTPRQGENQQKKKAK